jgi:hypothetical protein
MGRVGIMGGGRTPARPGGGGGPRPGAGGAPGAALGGWGGCRFTGGGAVRRGPFGDGGAFEPPPIVDEDEDDDDAPIIQSILTGGGAGALTVAMDTSPMMVKACLHAWYCLNISSRFIASSALSSIIDCVSPVAYRFARSSALMKVLRSLIMRNMMVFGTRSRQVLVTIFMYESTRLRIVST